MNSEDEKLMLFYAKETWLEQREATYTLSIIKDFLIFIGSLGASAYVYLEYGNGWEGVLTILVPWAFMVVYAKHTYQNKTDHLERSRKGEI